MGKRNKKQKRGESIPLRGYAPKMEGKTEISPPITDPIFHSFQLHFSKQSFEDQRRILSSLANTIKSPPYKITFKVEKSTLLDIAHTVTFCQEHKITFQTEKKGNTHITFIFEDLSERNKTLIGRLTV